MTVVVLTAVPLGLRGHLTRWLLEISPGVYIGHVSARVRELLWERVREFVEEGRALLVYSANNEQHLEFEVHGHDWTPVDYDGITLMRRHTAPDYVPAKAPSTQHPPERPELTEGATMSEEAVWKRRESRRKFRRK